VWSYLKSLFAPPRETTLFEEAHPGYRVLSGIARPDDAGVLRSPIKDETCMAFFYKATWKAPSRGASINRVFNQAEVYVSHFRLEMEGGSVVVVPKKTDTFDSSEHWKAHASGLPGFAAEEQLIRPGDRIQVRGRLRREDDDLVIRPARIEMVGREEVPAEKRKPRPKGKYHPRDRRKAQE